MTSNAKIKKKEKQLPLVVIFGRTNVGKSTLFNCLTEKKRALVSDIEGTTRDSNIEEVNWRDAKIDLIDTGGIMDIEFLLKKRSETNDIEARVQEQAREYIKKADIILFVVDSFTGVLPQDKQMALLVKKIVSKPNKIILVANKADAPKQRKEISEFHKLSLGEPIPVSAATGSGTGDLLDIVLQRLKELKVKKVKSEAEEEVKTIDVCVIGKPNVGKSSLLNSILGEDRVIVSPIAHTTREPQNTFLHYNDRVIKLVDTAGLSKAGQKNAKHKKDRITSVEDLTKIGMAKSLGALNHSDIALFIIDINEPITHQDQKIVQEIIEHKKSLIIIANKWDLVPEKDTKKYTEYIQGSFPFARWANIQFTSALTGEKVKKILDLILQIHEERQKEITDSQLNTFMMALVKIHRPSKGKGTKHPRIHKFVQTKSNPPQFTLRIGSKEDLHFSYVRFIENRLREKFGFTGTPITIRVVKNRIIHGKHDN